MRLNTITSFISIKEIKPHRYLPCITIAVMLLLSIHPALADYNFDGVPYTDRLEMVAHGTVNGGVYVDGGHGVGNARNPPYYTQSFNVPDGDMIFSRLYVGIWGGSETKTGTLQTTFNDYEFGTLNLGGETDTNPEVYCSGHGVYWVVYSTTEYVQSGSNTAVARTSGEFDGRVYGIILAAVYEDDSGEEVEYWITDGNPNLHGPGWSGDSPITNDVAHAYFSGIDPDSASAARLTVAYLCGSPYENDYLYFNDNKLNGDDVASSTNYFDLLTFDVTDFLQISSNARFERGDEDYIHPVLAVLTVNTQLTVTSATATPMSSSGIANTGILNENGRLRHTGDNETVISAVVADAGLGITSVTVDLSAIGGSTNIQLSGPYPNSGVYNVITLATSGINELHTFVVTTTYNGGNTVTAATNPLMVYRRGDVMRNNIVDMGDALYIARYTVGLESPGMEHFEFVGDVQPADGGEEHIVNMGDALYIARYTVGLETAP